VIRKVPRQSSPAIKRIAQIGRRNGRLQLQATAYDGREQATEAAFKTGPAAAKVCSMSQAYQDTAGGSLGNAVALLHRVKKAGDWAGFIAKMKRRK
jgi:hypothetical protein